MNAINDTVEVQPAPWSALAPWLAAAALLACLLYLVGFDQGALSRAGDLLHEMMHDGRHVLGVPCH